MGHKDTHRVGAIETSILFEWGINAVLEVKKLKIKKKLGPKTELKSVNDVHRVIISRRIIRARPCSKNCCGA